MCPHATTLVLLCHPARETPGSSPRPSSLQSGPTTICKGGAHADRSSVSRGTRAALERGQVRLLWLTGSPSSCLPRATGKRSSQVKVEEALLGSTPSAPITRQLLSVTLLLEPKPVVLNALHDTGAADNFIDQELADYLRLPTTELEHTISVTSVDGRPLHPYPI
uniref:Peptidase A2 domain-containing protein n=1 Tax=Nothobranchius furzeri TaxID=105023 RepID=A0A1A8UNB5_NOTFU